MGISPKSRIEWKEPNNFVTANTSLTTYERDKLREEVNKFD